MATKKRAKGVYLSTVLRSLGACEDSVAWAHERRGLPGGLRASWDACPQGGWMLWLASTLAARGDLSEGAYHDARRAYYGVSWEPCYDSYSATRADAIRAAVPFDVVLAALARAVPS